MRESFIRDFFNMKKEPKRTTPKDLALKWMSLFNCCCGVGFSREESLELVIAYIRGKEST